MFCNQCGSQIPDGSKFCHICGANQIIPQTGVQEVPTVQPSYEQEIQPNYAQPEYTQTNYTQTDYTQSYDGYNGQQYADNTQPAYVSNTVIPTAPDKKAGKPVSGKKKGLIIGGSIAATLIAAVAIVLIVLAPFKKKDKETSQLPFSKITYGMTRDEGLERYGEPYSTRSGYTYYEDYYKVKFMGVDGCLIIIYDGDDTTDKSDVIFSDAYWEYWDYWDDHDYDFRPDINYSYDTFKTLNDRLDKIEELIKSDAGVNERYYYDEDKEERCIEIEWGDYDALGAGRKDKIKAYELWIDERDGEFELDFSYYTYDDMYGDSYEEESTTEAVVEETTEATTEEEVNNSIIYVYSWNDELGEILEGFYNKYPEYRDRVVYKNLGVSSNELADYVNSAFNSSEVPSIVIYEDEYIDNLFDTERYCSMDEIGFDDSMLADMYPYTKDIATYNGRLMGLAPYACPGGFFYRTDIAEQVFGTSDPSVIGGYFSTWDGVLEAASMLKANGYYLVAETECVTRCMGDNYNQGVIDTMINNGYSKEVFSWSTDWYDGFRGDVFGMFGCSWFVYSYGGWGYDTAISTEVCTVPNGYYWGGSTIGVTRDCPDKELARLVLYSICCDYDTMYYNTDNTSEMPNNRSVVNSFIQEGKMPYDWYNIDSVSIQPHILSVFDEVGARVGQ